MKINFSSGVFGGFFAGMAVMAVLAVLFNTSGREDLDARWRAAAAPAFAVRGVLHQADSATPMSLSRVLDPCAPMDYRERGLRDPDTCATKRARLRGSDGKRTQVVQ